MLHRIVIQGNSCQLYKDGIKIPKLKLYSHNHCGRVGKANQNIATYRIGINTKKWWWAFFVWIPDMIVQNSWILYRTNKGPEDPYLDLLAFPREIATKRLFKLWCLTSWSLLSGIYYVTLKYSYNHFHNILRLFWCFNKFSFYHKWNNTRLLLINMVHTSCLTSCRTT